MHHLWNEKQTCNGSMETCHLTAKCLHSRAYHNIVKSTPQIVLLKARISVLGVWQSWAEALGVE